MGLMDPETGKIRLNSAMCATCHGNPRTGVKLRPGRLREVIQANTGDGKMGLTCHSTIDYDSGSAPDYGGDQALCRWFYDNFGHLANGIRVLSRLGGFTEVPPPVKKGPSVMTARLLTPRESAALRYIGTATGNTRTAPVATGPELARAIQEGVGVDISPAGAHAVAASLCRKSLAVRAGTSKLQWYTVTQPGRDAIRGDRSGQWVVRS